jgi:hypothetical protein
LGRRRFAALFAGADGSLLLEPQHLFASQEHVSVPDLDLSADANEGSVPAGFID